jgi:4-hydroxy-tetrahydrodipicolinate synthase
MSFGKLLTAMVTPFDQDGNVDFKATKSLVNYLLANGTDGIVVAGTTGESPTLSTEEKKALFECVVETANGRAPVIAGTASNNTSESVTLTKIAESVGVNGIMLVAPYYNKPSQEGMYLHFKTIAESTSLPVMLYNIPSRSAVNMSVETIIRLAQIDNIVSVKEASGDLDAIANIIQHTPDDFLLYSGDDSLTLPILSIGGHGVVSVSAHIVGNEMKNIITAFENGDVQSAAKLHRDLLPIIKAMFIAPNPVPVKAALEMVGQQVGSVRLPLVPLTLEESQAVYAAIKPRFFHSAI